MTTDLSRKEQEHVIWLLLRGLLDVSSGKKKTPKRVEGLTPFDNLILFGYMLDIPGAVPKRAVSADELKDALFKSKIYHKLPPPTCLEVKK